MHPEIEAALPDELSSSKRSSRRPEARGQMQARGTGKLRCSKRPSKSSSRRASKRYSLHSQRPGKLRSSRSQQSLRQVHAWRAPRNVESNSCWLPGSRPTWLTWLRQQRHNSQRHHRQRTGCGTRDSSRLRQQRYTSQRHHSQRHHSSRMRSGPTAWRPESQLPSSDRRLFTAGTTGRSTAAPQQVRRFTAAPQQVHSQHNQQVRRPKSICSHHDSLRQVYNMSTASTTCSRQHGSRMRSGPTVRRVTAAPQQVRSQHDQRPR